MFGEREQMVLFTLRPLRVVYVFRVLSILHHLEYIRRILAIVKHGSGLLVSVLCLLLFTILVFASFGISVWQALDVRGCEMIFA